MSILSNLKGKSKKWEPEPGVVIEIQPLSVGEGLDELFALETSTDADQIASAISTLMRTTLKKSVPDATEDEIENLALEYLVSLMEVVRDVNNLGAEASNSKAMDTIIAMQQAAQQK